MVVRYSSNIEESIFSKYGQDAVRDLTGRLLACWAPACSVLCGVTAGTHVLHLQGLYRAGVDKYVTGMAPVAQKVLQSLTTGAFRPTMGDDVPRWVLQPYSGGLHPCPLPPPMPSGPASSAHPHAVAIMRAYGAKPRTVAARPTQHSMCLGIRNRSSAMYI